MFERFRSFMSGVGQLIRNPKLIKQNQSRINTIEERYNRAVQDMQRLQEAYGQVNVELKFRKEMESEGIGTGRRYVDMELGPDLLLDHPEELQAQNNNVSVSYIEITGFKVKDGERWFETNLGDVRSERFLARKEQGKLVTMEQANRDVNQANRDVNQANTQKQPVTQEQETPAASVETLHRPGYAALTAQMKEAGYIFKQMSDYGDDFIIWEDVKVGKEFVLDGWEDVIDFLDEQKSLCGMLFYPGGGMYRFSDPDQLLKEFAKNLDYMGPTSVFIRTITDDPSVNKAVEDLVYNEFGEDNPHDLDYYVQRQGWIFLALLWTVLCTLLGRMAARGWPRWLAMPLTANFYAVRSWGGRWSIFQRRPRSARKADCKVLLRNLAEEQRSLPMALPPGRYRALTHATVLRRIRAMEDAVEVEAVPVYACSISGLRGQMTGGRCRRCKGRCPFPQDDGAQRQFYFVTFRMRWAGHLL